MLQLPFFLAGFMAISPVADTVWWNTPSGKVTEHKDGKTAQCTLTLRDDVMAIHWIWRPGVSSHAVVTRNDFKFGDDASLQVAVQIGDRWLGGGDGVPNLTALGQQSSVVFLVGEPIDDLFLAADHLTIHVDQAEYRMQLLHPKMVSLILALRRCRAATNS